MKRDVVLSLCDLTGNFVEPWVEAGYTAILVDPQHGETRWEGKVLKIADVVDSPQTWARIREYLPRLAFVAGFPPCTDVAISGSRWWEDKRKEDPYFQAKATRIAEQCKVIGELSGAPWFFENPRSAFSKIIGTPSFKFHPYQFTGWEPEDNYRKETWLWAGGGFVMPVERRLEGLGEPDNRIHFAPDSKDRANKRSATPKGFARAVFHANGRMLRCARGVTADPTHLTLAGR